MRDGKHQAQRVRDGEYLYRGVRILRNASVGSGYYGSWYAETDTGNLYGQTLKDCKKNIDRRMDMTRPAIGFERVNVADPIYKDGRAIYQTARWDGQPPRCPKKGELYLSGAIPAAYRAKNDLSSMYFIAVVVAD